MPPGRKSCSPSRYAPNCRSRANRADCFTRFPAGLEKSVSPPATNLTGMTNADHHQADSHDKIRVQGARENNLKDVDIELPKRRLTVFTGVSGSGKSSLVFGTIAAESRRLINETYSAFVQGIMPTQP